MRILSYSAYCPSCQVQMAPLQALCPATWLASPSQTLCLLIPNPTFSATCCVPPNITSTLFSFPAVFPPAHLPELKRRSRALAFLLAWERVQAGSGDSSGEFSHFLHQVFFAAWAKSGQRAWNAQSVPLRWPSRRNPCQTVATAGKMSSSQLAKGIHNLRIQIWEFKNPSGQRQGRRTKELAVQNHLPEGLLY